jgi:membrane-associated protease RseP (regulator of RpoE activity)
MKHLLRPGLKSHRNPALAVLAAAAVCLFFAPPAVRSQAQQFAPIFQDPSPLLAHAATPGYLGVDVADVDADKAQALKLKEVRGAVITLIDHDAPAGQIGLKVNDVVLAVDGQNVQGADQLRRMLREIPPGRKISLEISRDGNIQTLAVQLVDRKALDHEIWGKIGAEGATIEPAPPVPTMGVVGSDVPVTGSGHWPLFTSTLNVGALVEPLTSQMAEYFGVQGGLMVKQVARKSEAAAAGFKAFDVILKVGSDSINTSADWDRALRSNVGKPVQVTILRNKKQQTLTLQVDSKHRGALDYEELFGPENDAIVAELLPAIDSEIAHALSAQAQADLDAAAAQARAQADAIRRQIESMKNFNIDPKEMDQLRRQMDEFRKNFDDKQMKQLKQQMEQFRQRMMQDWCQSSRGNFV